MDSFETRTPDVTGWRGVPFRVPEQTADREAGKHDGGPMPPEAPRPQNPQPEPEKK